MVKIKFRFTNLLPILIVVMIIYEFNTFGWTIDASVNKVALGVVYGILLYILVFIIKTIVVPVWHRIHGREEPDFPRYIER
ncbi:MAG: hypothetical protein ACRECH_12405 [Nitrososphaerales archaeon]